jgi:Transposase
MTNSTNRVEIITSVQRRRRWTAPEKVGMVEETFEPGMTVTEFTHGHLTLLGEELSPDHYRHIHRACLQIGAGLVVLMVAEGR